MSESRVKTPVIDQMIFDGFYRQATKRDAHVFPVEFTPTAGADPAESHVIGATADPGRRGLYVSEAKLGQSEEGYSISVLRTAISVENGIAEITETAWGIPDTLLDTPALHKLPEGAEVHRIDDEEGVELRMFQIYNAVCLALDVPD